MLFILTRFYFVSMYQMEGLTLGSVVFGYMVVKIALETPVPHSAGKQTFRIDNVRKTSEKIGCKIANMCKERVSKPSNPR